LIKNAKYKLETLFLAARIFDRYLLTVNSNFFKNNTMVSVSTASVLLAAKMEESFRPNFLNIIDHLDDE
jgi:hypothetical protein